MPSKSSQTEASREWILLYPVARREISKYYKSPKAESHAELKVGVCKKQNMEMHMLRQTQQAETIAGM